MGTVHWIGIQIQCSMQTHCFEKTFNLIWIKLKKYLIAEGSSGSNGWAQVKSERTYSREPLLRTIFLLPTYEFKCFCTKTFPRKHVLVLVDLSTLDIPQTDSIWMSKRQLKKCTVTSIPSKTDTRISLRCQVALHFIAQHRRSTMTVWSWTIIPTYGF